MPSAITNIRPKSIPRGRGVRCGSSTTVHIYRSLFLRYRPLVMRARSPNGLTCRKRGPTATSYRHNNNNVTTTSKPKDWAAGYDLCRTLRKDFAPRRGFLALRMSECGIAADYIGSVLAKRLANTKPMFLRYIHHVLIGVSHPDVTVNQHKKYSRGRNEHYGRINACFNLFI